MGLRYVQSSSLGLGSPFHTDYINRIPEPRYRVGSYSSLARRMNVLVLGSTTGKGKCLNGYGVAWFMCTFVDWASH